MQPLHPLMSFSRAGGGGHVDPRLGQDVSSEPILLVTSLGLGEERKLVAIK